MEKLPASIIKHIHGYRPVHPCATAIKNFYKRIGYAGSGRGVGEEERLWFCLADYRAEPDYFDSRHDRKGRCVEAFYRWGDEFGDPRLHGGRL